MNSIDKRMWPQSNGKPYQMLKNKLAYTYIHTHTHTQTHTIQPLHNTFANANLYTHTHNHSFLLFMQTNCDTVCKCA